LNLEIRELIIRKIKGGKVGGPMEALSKKKVMMHRY